MKKFLLASMFCLLGLGFVKANGVTYVLVLQTNSGTIQEHEFSSKPKVTFSSTVLNLWLDGQLYHSFERADINDIHFTVKGGQAQGGSDNPLPTEIEEVPVARYAYLDNSVFRIEGDEAKAVAVYDISGRRQPAQIFNNVGSVEIHLGNLPTGIYLIRTHQSTYKIVKR